MTTPQDRPQQQTYLPPKTIRAVPWYSGSRLDFIEAVAEQDPINLSPRPSYSHYRSVWIPATPENAAKLDRWMKEGFGNDYGVKVDKDHNLIYTGPNSSDDKPENRTKAIEVQSVDHFDGQPKVVWIVYDGWIDIDYQHTNLNPL